MRILMVSPYPPLRDGLASYAVQAVAALRKAGHEVEALSPSPSAAHYHLDLQSHSGLRELARLTPRYDRVVIQFHPDVFYPIGSSPAEHAATSAALRRAVRAARSTEVCVHEIDYRQGRRRDRDGAAARRLWREVDSIVFHTEVERQSFVEAFGVQPDRVTVTSHGADFVRRTSMTRERARRSLRIPEDQLVFLAIGFIQEHKGFDRAVRAFDGMDAERCALHIVGSVRVDEPAYLAYLAELTELAESTPGVQLHNQYVSDELFDRWLVASDVVVLPYRNIWSSGVLERALLYDRRVIATAVGGLSHQAADRPGVTIVEGEALGDAMRAELRRATGLDEATVDAWPECGQELRQRVQDEVVSRATRRRGQSITAARETVAALPALPLQRLSPLVLPAPRSRRPAFTVLKRLVRSATAFEVDPVVDHVNALRELMIQALQAAGSRK